MQDADWGNWALRGGREGALRCWAALCAGGRDKEVRWEGPRPQRSPEGAFVQATGSLEPTSPRGDVPRLGICLPFPSMLGHWQGALRGTDSGAVVSHMP